ncbi:hypothetical protein [Aeromicrobium sp.]|jgi:hypothetical protein|uniref:hypothetical protein n=1 Tax=Aeromicrobium sp. TaxID=1871063 RepID=UPI003C6B1FF0
MTESKRFARLPEPIRPEDMVEEVDTRAIPDPEGGRDTDRDFLIRYGLGGL